jgi:cobyrinic acid a,c-diamide synthase
MVVIAGTNSGAGKTSTAIALTRALARRGLRVQTFKVGPDFLDPTYLALASGRSCYNLDGWMAGTDYCRRLFERTTADADFVIMEGVMGLFDGADPQSSEGSTAEIARLFDIPILLVVNVHGMARSFAALVLGFTTFEPGLRFAGVIANYCGSSRHTEWLSLSLTEAGLPQLAGSIPRGAFPEIPSRHLGLVTAQRGLVSESFVDAIAAVLENNMDVEKLLAGSGATAPSTNARPAAKMSKTPTAQRITENAKHPLKQIGGESSPRIGIAWDDAFHFYYADLLDELKAAGCEIAFFSPLDDNCLPENLSGMYLGGGYPELYAEKLAANTKIIEEIQKHADSGRPLYAECGGLMYLSSGIEAGNVFHPLCGILPARTKMRSGRKALGYVEITLAENSLWGDTGVVFRGHEFHYSELIDDPTSDPAWRRIYKVRRRRSEKVEEEGFQRGAILASYHHLHLASRPAAIDHFVKKCGGKV